MAVKEVKLSTIEEVLTTLTTAEFNDALKPFGIFVSRPA